MRKIADQLCEWDWRGSRLGELAQQYHDVAEAYDQQICTGPLRQGLATPATPQERRMICSHALRLREQLLAQARRELGLVTEQEWQRAIIEVCNHG